MAPCLSLARKNATMAQMNDIPKEPGHQKRVARLLCVVR